MRLVQLRIFAGDPSLEGDLVFVAPSNVATVALGMTEPPCAEVWLAVGPMMLVEGSVEHVASLIADGEITRREDPYFARARAKARAEQQVALDDDASARPRGVNRWA